MNQFQEIWWQQASSDFDIFLQFRRRGNPVCHTLHYLQMSTEKLGKAYLWRKNTHPPTNHAGFTQLLQGLGQVRGAKRRQHISTLFGYGRFRDFRSWISTIMPIAHEVQRLAPSFANNGPNPEYPWPHQQPSNNPINHTFCVWDDLTVGQGRGLMIFIQDAVREFPNYAQV